MRIIIKTVPHECQRYNTIGDWRWIGDTLEIKVSSMGDWRKEFLVGIHEAVETMLCKHDGVSEQQVDDFDFSRLDLHEPGSSPDAPYHKQHNLALDIESLLMHALEVDQKEYEMQMEELQCVRDLHVDPLA